MHVEASDIMRTAMNTGDDDSTGCEQAALASEECVEKNAGAGVSGNAFQPNPQRESRWRKEIVENPAVGHRLA